MIPVFNMKMFASHYQTISNYVEKMNKNELSLEDILKQDEVVNDLKTNGNSQFNAFFNKENIKRLIDYSIKMPEEDELIKGHKYPFNACEILSSDSDMILDLLTLKEKEKETKDNVNDSFEGDHYQIEDDDLRDRPKDLDDDNCNDSDRLDININLNKEIHSIGAKDKDNELNDLNGFEKPKEEIKVSEDDGQENNINTVMNNDLLKHNEEVINEKETKEIPNNGEIVNDNHIEEYCNEKQINQSVIYNNNGYENLNHLFNFLNSSSDEFNYVLIGYFNRIFTNLIEKKGDIIISFILESNDILFDHLINHLNRQLIGECVYRILTYSTEGNYILNERKIVFISKLIDELKTTTDEDKYTIICFTFKNSLSDCQFFKLIMTKLNILPIIFNLINSNESKKNESKLNSLYSLLIQMLNNVLKSFKGIVTVEHQIDSTIDMQFIQPNIGFDDAFGDFEDKSKQHLQLGDTDESNNEQLQIVLLSLLNTLIESKMSLFDDLGSFNINSSSSIKETTYLRSQRTLGIVRVSQTELFSIIIDIIINSLNREYFKDKVNELIDIITNSNIFNALIEIFFTFEFNNMYQNIFHSILISIINKSSPFTLVKHVFIKESILERMRDNLMMKRIFNFNSNQIQNSCLLPFEISFLNEVHHSESEYIKKIIEEKNDIARFIEIYIDDINKIFKGKLCQRDNDPLAYNNKQAQMKHSKEYDDYTGISLNELIDVNANIYNVYQSGGDYKTLLEEKERKKEKNRDTENKGNMSLNSNELDANKEIELDEDIILDIDNLDINGKEKQKRVQKEEEDKEYYDNNYWSVGVIAKLELNDEDLLKDLN